MKVVESKTAVREVDTIADYLSENFSSNVVEVFLINYTSLLKLLTQFPKAYQTYPRLGHNYRRAVVDQLTVVYYVVYPNRVVIRRVMDARSRPL